MNSASTPAEVVESGTAAAPPLKAKERLLSLDIFRGMTLIAMTMVNMPGDEHFSYAPFTHVRWNGWTIADLIFPFFIFIVGVAMPYSFAGRLARGESKGKLVAHILLRTTILFAVGVFMNWYTNFMGGTDRYHLANIRIFGALQRIALCYFFASLLYLKLKPKGLAITSATILVLYFILLKFIPVPGHGAGVLVRDGNWVQFIDLHLMPGHLGSATWESKGFLGTLPVLAGMLIGVLAGLYLRSAHSAMEKVRAFLVAGNVGLLLGLIWNVWLPINQNLWTSSLVVFISGMALVILACCYYLADVPENHLVDETLCHRRGQFTFPLGTGWRRQFRDQPGTHQNPSGERHTGFLEDVDLQFPRCTGRPGQRLRAVRGCLDGSVAGNPRDHV